MNDLLRDTLHERADGAEPPPLDLDGIMAAGKHRAGRRRALGVLSGAVATAAVAAGTATVIRPRDTRRRLIAALKNLENKRDKNPPKKHGNIPL